MSKWREDEVCGENVYKRLSCVDQFLLIFEIENLTDGFKENLELFLEIEERKASKIMETKGNWKLLKEH